MSIEALREKALNHNRNVTWTYAVCLDDDLRGQLNDATKALVELRKQEAEEADKPQAQAPEKPKAKNLGAKPVTIANQITAAEQKVQEIEDSIPDDDLLVLRFGRLTPDRYQQLQTDNLREHDGKLDLWEMQSALAADGFRAAEDRHGIDTGISWEDIRANVLDSLDLEIIHMGLVQLNRSGAAIPFGPKSSGRPATS
ncbi:hypothetical protein [Propionibacterium freudenreichii]|uniref:hypothetical protein n=1 Tax=Propionibacterium freudenreichii TaxID=1744 RepID=UPI00254D811C|nr:hypothetical protein [Propionibacterium freudenreichii]MDK9627013.1 hypothetical protein [Propionibacterium freudenreichii]